MTEKMSREKFSVEINKVVTDGGRISVIRDFLTSLLPSEKEEKEVCPRCGGTKYITEEHRGRIYDMETYGYSGRPCPDCVKEPILEYKGFKVGDRVSLKGWPEEERVIESFQNILDYGVCARFNKDTGAGFNPVDDIEHIPPADGGKEEEFDMKGLLCEGCGRTHLRCKCPENSVEFWKHRCEQWEKRWKELLVESDDPEQIFEYFEMKYPLDRE